MLNSIKSKITVLTFALLVVLGLVVTGAAITAFYHDKGLIIAGNNASIATFENQLNTEIADLEKNAKDLALIGEIYYQNGRPQTIGEIFSKRLLENYPNSMGNGLWFEPYIIQGDRKAFCIHALRENGEISLLPGCVSGKYDYFKQNWYQEIMQALKAGKHLAWTKPYKSSQVEFLMTTVGVGIYNQGKLLGTAMVDWQMDTILKSILQIKPTPNSFVLFADKTNDYIIATTEPSVDNGQMLGQSLKSLSWYSNQLKEGTPFDYNGKKYIPYIKKLHNGLFLIVNIPLVELFGAAIHHLCVLLSVLLLSTLVIVSILYLVLKHNINQPISKLTEIAQKISRGDLEKTIQLDKPTELAKLAKSFNKMKTDIKTQIMQLAKVSNEKEKIESELSIAHTIQVSALPTDFPKHKNFELVASMTAAKEVGGDFYDFFPLDETHYAFVMADVSGKGITAALYMMSAKAMIKNMLQAGYPLEDAMNRANKGLCDNHARGMFVTAFIGVLDIKTGQISYVNAGHCAPLHKTKKGYDYVKVVRNLALGITPTYTYESGKFTLKNNDRLFLYTDGVTEAQTKEEKLFGPERLQKALNQKELSLSGTITQIHKAIQQFVKGAEQSDDITMMVIEFHPKSQKE